MVHRLIHALIESKNEAADELLLEALRVGNEQEQAIALDALVQRDKPRGLTGVVEAYEALPESLQNAILRGIKTYHHALRECGRSDRPEARLAAIKLIALGRQGKLAYVLSENMHDQDETVAKTATDAMVALARWIAMDTRSLQRGAGQLVERGQGIAEKGQGSAERGQELLKGGSTVGAAQGAVNVQQNERDDARYDPSTAEIYQAVMDNRTDIEAALARALDVHRGKHGQEILRGALLLCDWPGSKTLAILSTHKHAGQSPMVRRMQQPPAAEHVDAFLLGASHGQLRSHFGIVFSHIDEAPVLDALLRKTHWLKDHQLQLCVHQVTRGVWWGDQELAHDIERRPACDSAKIAEWLCVSGMHDVMQDERMERLRQHAREDFPARLRLLRLAMARKRGASVGLIKTFLTDPDERLIRLAAREIIRRRPMDFENILLQLMTTAPLSVRKVVGRSIGHVGFEHFWQRFDRMDKATRRQAGRAMLKLLPDATARLARRLSAGPVDQRVKAMQVVQELSLSEVLRNTLLPLINHPNSKVRSKAVSVIGEIPTVTPDLIMEKVLNDADPRVRANAIEVLETKRATEFVPLLAQRARSAHSRERANAIKAMGRMKVGAASTQLLHMLRDTRSEHRISAMWALKQIGWWQLLSEVGQIARADDNLRVRRYALGVLKSIAATVQPQVPASTAAPATVPAIAPVAAQNLLPERLAG